MAQAALYLDECVNVEVAVRLNAAGYDVISALEAGMLRASDKDQLGYAVLHGRALFTHDLRDFGRIARERAAGERSHAGIIYSSEARPSILAGWLEDLLKRHSAEELINCTLSVPLAG